MTDRLRPVLETTTHALVSHWRLGLGVAGAGAAGVAAAAMVVRFRDGALVTGTSLPLDRIPDTENAVTWTPQALAPDALRHGALGELFSVLLVLAVTALVLAAFVILGRATAGLRDRAPEFGIRRAVGASRRTIVEALLTEAALVSVVLVASGLLIGTILAHRAAAAWPLGEAGMGPLPWWVGVVGVAAVLLGWMTALRFLKRGHMVHPPDRTVSLWTPGIQIALAVALLTTGGVLLERGRTLAAANAAQPAGGAVVALDTGRLTLGERSARYRQLLDELKRADAYVAFAAITAPGEALGLGTVDEVMTPCNCVVMQVVRQFMNFDATHHFVSPDSFASPDMALLEGRRFTADDVMGGERVVIVNRHLAARYYAGGRALGRNLFLRRGFWRRPYTVIGVVDDAAARGLGGGVQPRPAVYLPVLQHPPARADLVIRPATAGADTIGRVTTLAAGILGADAVGPVRMEADVAWREILALRWFATGFVLTGLAALLVALTGVVGSTRAWVRSHAFEFALRRAVGASRRRITGFVMLRTLRMVVAGVASGALIFMIVLRDPLTTVVPSLPLMAPGVLPWAMAGLGGVATLAALMALAALNREHPASRLS